MQSTTYCQTSNLSRTLVANEIVDQSDVLGAASALLQLHLHSRFITWLQWIGQRQLQDEMRVILDILRYLKPKPRTLMPDRAPRSWVTCIEMHSEKGVILPMALNNKCRENTRTHYKYYICIFASIEEYIQTFYIRVCRDICKRICCDLFCCSFILSSYCIRVINEIILPRVALLATGQ